MPICQPKKPLEIKFTFGFRSVRNNVTQDIESGKLTLPILLDVNYATSPFLNTRE